MRETSATVEEGEQQHIQEEHDAMDEDDISLTRSKTEVKYEEEENDASSAIDPELTAEFDDNFMACEQLDSSMYEREIGFKKHRMSETSETLEKRVRISALAATQPKSTPAKREKLSRAEDVMVRTSTEHKDITHSEPPSSAMAQERPEITILLAMPSDGMFSQIQNLPAGVCGHLIRRLESDYSFDAAQPKAYDHILAHLKPSECYDHCLNKVINGEGSCTWVVSNGKSDYACDFCTETGQICARFLHGSACRLAIYSRPLAFRRGVKEMQLEYWLQEPQDLDNPPKARRRKERQTIKTDEGSAPGILVWMPKKPKFRPLAAVPQHAATFLLAKLTTDYDIIAGDKDSFENILKYPEPENWTNLCINVYLRTQGHGRCGWKKPDQSTKTACDSCIKANKLCV